MKIYKPFYMIGKKIPCWSCGRKMSVVGFLATKTDHEELEGEPCILLDISEISRPLLDYVQVRAPNFKLQYSKTVNDSYYGSSCPHCKTLYGDYFLHSEPSAAFFPNDEKEAAELYIAELPVDDVIDIEAGFHYGAVDLVLDHAVKIS